MLISTRTIMSVGILLAIITMAGNLCAQDVKERMRERLPILVALKARGIVGENNQGFLEMLKGQTEQQDVVAAENQDRKSIYAKIAQQTGTEIQVVGQRRAMQIAEKAAPGEWLQDPGGNWRQK